MSVHPRNNIYHYDFWYQKVRYQGSTECRTKEGALAFEAAYRKALVDDAGSQPIAPSALTFAEVVETAIASRTEYVGSQEVFNREMRNISIEIGPDMLVGEITHETLTKLILAECTKFRLLGGHRDLLSPKRIEVLLFEKGLLDNSDRRLGLLELRKIHDEVMHGLELETGDPLTPSNSTIRKSLINPLFYIVKFARDTLGVNFKSPPVRSRLRYRPNKRERILGFAEQRRLKAVARPDMWPIYEFAIWSLLRKENILELRWDEVFFEEGEIRLRQKDDRVFYRHINSAMRRILEAQVGYDETYVFTFRMMTILPKTSIRFLSDERRPILEGTLHNLWHEDLANAGIEGLTFHDLRRTGATRLFTGSKDIQFVSHALGHTTPESTWHYIGRRPAHDAASELQRRIYEEIEDGMAAMKEAGRPSGLTLAEEVVAVNAAVSMATAPAAALAYIVREHPELRQGLLERIFGIHLNADVSAAVQAEDQTSGTKATTQVLEEKRSNRDGKSGNTAHAVVSRMATTDATITALVDRTPDGTTLRHEMRARIEPRTYWYTATGMKLVVPFHPDHPSTIDSRFVFKKNRSILKLPSIDGLRYLLRSGPFWIEAAGIRVLVYDKAHLIGLWGYARMHDNMVHWVHSVRTALKTAGMEKEFWSDSDREAARDEEAYQKRQAARSLVS